MKDLKSMVKVFLLVVSWNLICTLPAYADVCSLNSSQKSVLYFSYAYGDQFDYGLTMAAIAMEESNLGQWNINVQDPSASPWGITLDKAVTEMGWVDTSFNRNRAAQKLMEDHEFAARLAIQTLFYWHHQYEGDWQRVVSSYNGGWKGSDKYLVKISNHIRRIRDCEWLKGLK